MESRRMKRDMHNQPTSDQGVSYVVIDSDTAKTLTKQNHQGSEMGSPQTHAQFHGRIPSQRDHEHPERRHHDPHCDVWHSIRVNFTGLELEAPIIAGEQASKTDEHLSQRRVHVEVEFPLEVVGPEFAEVGLVPDDHVGFTDFMEPGPT